MKKEQWLLALKELDKLQQNLDDSDLAGYMRHKDSYKNSILNFPEVYDLITGRPGTSEIARSFAFDDFLKHGHHKFDINNLREAFRSKIETL